MILTKLKVITDLDLWGPPDPRGFPDQQGPLDPWGPPDPQSPLENIWLNGVRDDTKGEQGTCHAYDRQTDTCE